MIRRPARSSPYGEWLPNAQGEDVVAGIRTPMAILANRGQEKDSLEHRMPEAFKELVAICAKLESHFRDMQDLEFTIQSGKLYMLQCRNGKRTGRAAVRVAVEMVKEGLLTNGQKRSSASDAGRSTSSST